MDCHGTPKMASLSVLSRVTRCGNWSPARRPFSVKWPRYAIWMVPPSHNGGLVKEPAPRGFVGYNSPTTPKRGRKFLRTQIVFGVLVVLAALAAPASLAAQAAPANTAEGTPDPSTDREFSAKLSVCNACHDVNGRRKYASHSGDLGSAGKLPPETAARLREWSSNRRGHVVDGKIPHAAGTEGRSDVFRETDMAGAVRWRRLHAAAPPGIAVCQGCHDTAAAPRLAGQSYEYLVEAMRRFAEGERKNNAIMTKMMAIDPARRTGGDGALSVRPLIGSSVIVRMFRRLLVISYSS